MTVNDYNVDISEMKWYLTSGASNTVILKHFHVRYTKPLYKCKKLVCGDTPGAGF